MAHGAHSTPLKHLGVYLVDPKPISVTDIFLVVSTL